MKINEQDALRYIDNWILLVDFVEEYDYLCHDLFFDSDLALELGKHKALKFYEDSENFVKWIGEMIPNSHNMGFHLYPAWLEFLHHNEERLPSLEY